MLLKQSIAKVDEKNGSYLRIFHMVVCNRLNEASMIDEWMNSSPLWLQTFRHDWWTIYMHKMDCTHLIDRNQSTSESNWAYRMHSVCSILFRLVIFLIITLHWFCMSLILTICLLLPHKNSSHSLAKSTPSLSHVPSLFVLLFSHCFHRSLLELSRRI